MAPEFEFCVSVSSVAAKFPAVSLRNQAFTSIVSAPPAAAKPEVASRFDLAVEVKVTLIEVSLTRRADAISEDDKVASAVVVLSPLISTTLAIIMVSFNIYFSQIQESLVSAIRLSIAAGLSMTVLVDIILKWNMFFTMASLLPLSGISSNSPSSELVFAFSSILKTF